MKIKKDVLLKAKILLIDIETSPNEGLFWRPGSKQSISHHQIVKERQIICVCWKWAGEKEIHSLDFGLNKQDDTTLLKKLTKVINSANVIIGQNHDKFDLPWIQGRLFIKQLPPISFKGTTVTLDTLKLMRGSLGLNAYRLDYVSKLMGLGGKIRMDFQDWFDIVVHKDKKAFDKMLKYCPKDVADLESIFFKILPYVKLSTHLGKILYPDLDSKKMCPNCGSTGRYKKGTRTLTSGYQYRRYECTSCWKAYIGERI